MSVSEFVPKTHFHCSKRSLGCCLGPFPALTGWQGWVHFFTATSWRGISCVTKHTCTIPVSPAGAVPTGLVQDTGEWDLQHPVLQRPLTSTFIPHSAIREPPGIPHHSVQEREKATNGLEGRHSALDISLQHPLEKKADQTQVPWAERSLAACYKEGLLSSWSGWELSRLASPQGWFGKGRAMRVCMGAWDLWFHFLCSPSPIAWGLTPPQGLRSTSQKHAGRWSS